MISNNEIKEKSIQIKLHSKQCKRTRLSKLNKIKPYVYELKLLHTIGGVSLRDLSIWLKHEHNISISHTSIATALDEI